MLRYWNFSFITVYVKKGSFLLVRPHETLLGLLWLSGLGLGLELALGLTLALTLIALITLIIFRGAD